MVMSFSNTWQSIEELLINNAESIGIESHQISSGEPDEAIAPVPPYIKIFALPDSEFESSIYSPECEFMRFTFFVAGASGASLRHSVQSSVALALRCRNFLINSIPAIIQDENSRIAPQAIFSNYSLMSFDIIVPFLSNQE